jgi:hypothetical protein
MANPRLAEGQKEPPMPVQRRQMAVINARSATATNISAAGRILQESKFEASAFV